MRSKIGSIVLLVAVAIGLAVPALADPATNKSFKSPTAADFFRNFEGDRTAKTSRQRTALDYKNRIAHVLQQGAQDIWLLQSGDQFEELKSGGYSAFFSALEKKQKEESLTCMALLDSAGRTLWAGTTNQKRCSVLLPSPEAYREAQRDNIVLDGDRDASLAYALVRLSVFKDAYALLALEVDPTKIWPSE